MQRIESFTQLLAMLFIDYANVVNKFTICMEISMIFEKVREIIAEQLSKEESNITMETNFKEDLDADSLDLFQVINEIEDEFDVKIEETDGLETVGDVVKLIENKER